MQAAFGRTLHIAAVCGVVAVCSTVAAAQDIPVQSASRPAPTGDDEIVIYGSISELRRQMLSTRDAMFTRFNEINSDDKFDIH